MMIDYIYGCAHAQNLGIAAQTKIMREPSLIFLGLWFDFLQLRLENYNMVS
jgi:hypothetical protein